MSELPATQAETARYPYLAALNEAQRESVEALDGPVLVLAGAGTGKTRTLTTRLAHLLVTGRAHAGQILAVTFTNRAAREMKNRVAKQLGHSVDGWWLGTFHSMAARILRFHAEQVGLRPNFTILDTDDQLRLLKQVLEAGKIDAQKWPARKVLAAIERWKDRGLGPDKVSASDARDIAGRRGRAIYASYQERLRNLNAADFGDLILHNLTLFQDFPEVLADYHRRFHYVLVDEYQDTNKAQHLWLSLIAQGHRNLCCVGDDDQSIYGWRGAEVGNILRFENDFPGAKVIRLERNYRSTGHILAAASGLIAHNKDRLGKTLWTKDNEGAKLRLRGLWDSEAEARFVGEEIQILQRGGHPLSEIAILLRTGAQTRELEERFMTLGLPYRIVGGARFYERLEIRDALAYLRVIETPSHDLAFERIINKPKRGLGAATLRLLHQRAHAAQVPLFEAARRLLDTDELRPAARYSLGGLLDDFERWRGMLEQLPHPELMNIVLEESGYMALWMADKSADAPGRLENLMELVNAAAEFDNLASFLEHVALFMELNEVEDQNMVNIMTLHSAKGMEFDTVFLAGWEEGLLPNERALKDHGLRALEEERRLAHVGLTRARQRVVLSFATRRRWYGHWVQGLPSRFVDELPKEHVEMESDPGVYVAPGASSELDLGGGRVGPVLDDPVDLVEDVPPTTFAEGMCVFHKLFHYGTVAAVDGDRLDIDFDEAGKKRVLARFVVLED